MTLHILPIYTALFAILFVMLSLRTARLRRSLKIAVGDSGDQKMLRAIRAHSNFAEYVPFCLLLLTMAELQGQSPAMLHGLCIALLLGRISHAYGVSQVREKYRFRVFGMTMTIATMISTSVFLLGAALGKA